MPISQRSRTEANSHVACACHELGFSVRRAQIASVLFPANVYVVIQERCRSAMIYGYERGYMECLLVVLYYSVRSLFLSLSLCISLYFFWVEFSLVSYSVALYSNTCTATTYNSNAHIILSKIDAAKYSTHTFNSKQSSQCVRARMRYFLILKQTDV